MKHLIFIYILVIGTLFCKAQNKKWIIQDSSLTIDSLSQRDAVNSYLDSLVNIGYYTLHLDSVNTSKKKVFVTKGPFLGSIKVDLDSLSQKALYPLKSEDYDPIELKNILLQKLEDKGFSFAEIKSRISHDTLFIRTITQKKRTIDDLLIHTDLKLPQGYSNELKNEFIGKVFSTKSLKEIDQDINQSPFIQLQKPSQVLFLKDSTLVYLYPKRTKKSFFDGIMGFTNSENGDFKITGNVDLQLGNIFNSFETLLLHWNSSANESQDFNLSFLFPYIGRTPLGSKTYIKIFRQDSTFVNLDISQDLFYRLNRRTQIGINGFLQNSTYLENDSISNSTSKDFSKNGIGLRYSYKIPIPIALFEHRFQAELGGSYINTHIENSNSERQYSLYGVLDYLYTLNDKNYIFSKLSYKNLLAKSFVDNELFRIGGLYTLRGFNENSLIANQYLLGTLEYRYLANEALYFSVFSDMGNLRNEIQQTTHFLISFGAGLNFRTRYGLFSLQYALGKFPKRSFDFDNSKIHIGFKALF